MNDSLPNSSTAAVFAGAGKPLELETISLPTPEAGEAIVRIRACTVCGSDLHTVTGRRNEPVPSILGHEIVGNVVAVGSPPPRDEAGQVIKIGQRVTWSVCVSCRECSRCRSGLPQKCETVFKYGHAQAIGRTALSGGLAEFILLRNDSAIFSLSEDLPDEIACPANCATATVAAVIRRAGELKDKRVFIFGAGLLGLTASAFAWTQQAAAVVVCDLNEDRLKLAADFGADLGVLPENDFTQFQQSLRSHGVPDEFDIVLELSGANVAVERSVELAALGATIVLAGSVMPGEVNIDPQVVVRKLLSLHGVHNYAPQDLQTAISFLNEFGEQFPFAGLVGPAFSLHDVNSAFEYALTNKPVRVVIRP